MRSIVFLILLVPPFCFAQTSSSFTIQRRLPPVGDAIEASDREMLADRIQTLREAMKPLQDHAQYADAAVLVKAVAFALTHNEFYKPGDVKKAIALLEVAGRRIEELRRGDASWMQDRGRVVLGYRSTIDDSLQPLAMEIGEGVDLTKPAPLYVWLHGRGDTTTDMHFLDQRINRAGKIKVDDALIVHPFGRHCVGFKHAGEVDVLDVIDQVASRYLVDRQRIVLIGFSMGGAGAWHIGAHFTDRFAAVCPGAGFAETRRYQNISVDAYPPQWEQTLWKVYDAPNYVRNLFNVPVIAYSGEKDKQIQAARVMEEAFAAEGRMLDHRIGPGMGHQYHPDTLRQILSDLHDITHRSPDPMRPVHLQTATLRYPKMRWVHVTGLVQHYRDTRVDAVHEAGRWIITTSNVSQLTIEPPGDATSVDIDGQSLPLEKAAPTHLARGNSGTWMIVDVPLGGLRKRQGLQGPIDDVFMRPFLVVLPSGEHWSMETQRWVEFESRHFVARWTALMRGEPRVKLDTEVTEQDVAQFNLILWGDPQSNQWIRRVMDGNSEFALPIQWNEKSIEIAGKGATGAFVPVLIYPNPLHPSRYVAINAGLTFREQQDRTNSLQNPRLPDWAIIGLDQPPSDAEPGNVTAAGFFGESW